MILTKSEILKEVKKGNIKIDPFDPANLGPNSYNVSLGNKLKFYDIGDMWYVRRDYLHPEELNETREIDIPKEGLVISPKGYQEREGFGVSRVIGGCFLAATLEYTEVHGNIVPMLHGRSSWARLFLDVHKTAGFGDVGFKGTWTLELQPHLPVLIKPGYKIAQLAFHRVEGELENYRGKYVGQVEPTESRLYEEFECQEKRGS